MTSNRPADASRHALFIQADGQYKVLHEAGRDETEEALVALLQIFRQAPQGLKNEMWSLGLMPRPDGYNQNEEPVFWVDTIARHLGLNKEEVGRKVEQFATLVPASQVQRVH